MACPLGAWPRAPQAPRRSGDVGAEPDKTPPRAPDPCAVCAAAGGRTPPGRPSLAHGQGHPCARGGAAREAQGRHACGAQHDAGAAGPQHAGLLGVTHGPESSAGWGAQTGGRGRPCVPVGAHGSTTGKAAIARPREPVHPSLKPAGSPPPRTCVAAPPPWPSRASWSHHRRAHPPPRRSTTAPEPLAPVLACGPACARLGCLPRGLARAQCPLSSRCPCVPGRCCNSGGDAAGREPDGPHACARPPRSLPSRRAQSRCPPARPEPRPHLQRYHDLCFRGPPSDKDRLTCCSKGPRTGVTAPETALATWGERAWPARSRCPAACGVRMHARGM